MSLLGKALSSSAESTSASASPASASPAAAAHSPATQRNSPSRIMKKGGSGNSSNPPPQREAKTGRSLPEHDIQVIDGATQLTLKRNVTTAAAAAAPASSSSSSKAAMPHRGFFSPLSLAAPAPAALHHPPPQSPPPQYPLPVVGELRGSAFAEATGREHCFERGHKGEGNGWGEIGKGSTRLWGAGVGGESWKGVDGSSDKRFVDCEGESDEGQQGMCRVTAADVHDAARDGAAAWDGVVARLLGQLEGKQGRAEQQGENTCAGAAAVSAAVIEACRWW
jgi:hypothetical protein